MNAYKDIGPETIQEILQESANVHPIYRGGENDSVSGNDPVDYSLHVIIKDAVVGEGGLRFSAAIAMNAAMDFLILEQNQFSINPRNLRGFGQRPFKRILCRPAPGTPANTDNFGQMAPPFVRYSKG